MRRAALCCSFFLSLLGIFAPWARAVDPGKSFSQYIHNRWGIEEGFLGGNINAIAQSGDGYLWVGTERGLVRFDGHSFLFIQRPIPGQPAIGPVRGLVTGEDGALWIRLNDNRLLCYRNGRFYDAISQFGLAGKIYTAMSLDNRGGVLLADVANDLNDFYDGHLRQSRTARVLPGTIISLAETRDGTRWLGTEDDGLFHDVNGRYVLVSDAARDRNINALLPAPSGGLWIGTDHGLEWWVDNALTRYQEQGLPNNLMIFSMARDKENNLWLGTDHGLIRITMNGPATIDPQKTGPVTAVYADDQGEIWFGGEHGLERLRDGAFTPYTVAQGLPTNDNGPIYVDSAGRTWAAPLSGGLYWFQDGQVHSVVLDGLAHDVVYSIDGADNAVWVGRQQGGLTRLTFQGASLTAKTYRHSDGLAEDSVFAVMTASDGSVWAGTVSEGASRLENRRFETFSRANGISSDTVNAIAQGQNGAIWLATPNGLEEYLHGKWRVLTSSSGLPSSDVRTLFDDEQGVLWIATSAGLAYLQSGQLHVPSHLPESLREPICGIAEDMRDSLWFSTSDHLLKVNRTGLLADHLSEEDVSSYGVDDGLPGVEGVSRNRSVISDSRHRIWLSVQGGVAMTDPHLTQEDTQPAQPRIEAVSAGNQQLDPTQPLRIAPGSGNLTLTFGVDSLAELQRIRFRHRLVGLDRHWSEISPVHQVTYTNLAPGKYRFEVAASNAAGLWNGGVATLRFTVEPAFWQTWWFRTAAVLLSLLLLTALYRLRSYQMMQKMNLRFHERLAERTRIAQDLHDTLLQGVLSASMQLDLAADQVPEDSPARPRLQRVASLMSRVTEEGRSALRGLRTPGDERVTLAQALSQFAEHRSAQPDASFRVVLLSDSRPLRPMIRDEVFSIGREAIANAFRHAQPQNVEVEIEYSSSCLRVVIKDDGCGIDPAVLSAGREGHWGLIGMRERSEKVGGRLRLLSRIGAGTEVELTIPAAIAFLDAPVASALQWRAWAWRKLSARRGNRDRGE